MNETEKLSEEIETSLEPFDMPLKNLEVEQIRFIENSLTALQKLHDLSSIDMFEKKESFKSDKIFKKRRRAVIRETWF